MLVLQAAFIAIINRYWLQNNSYVSQRVSHSCVILF